jgi:hypothetical protein
MRRTIDSCVNLSYEKRLKLLSIVTDGIVPAAGEKPTNRVLLEDIVNHREDLEASIGNFSRPYTFFDTNSVSENKVL